MFEHFKNKIQTNKFLCLIKFTNIHSNPDNTTIIWDHAIFRRNSSRISQHYLNSAPSGVSTSKVKMRNSEWDRTYRSHIRSLFH